MLIIKKQKPFLVYDITRKETFDSVDKWIPDLKANGSKNISIIIIGNKSDLEDKRQVTKEDAEQKAKNFNVAFMETSALSGNNIEHAFDTMVKGVYNTCRKETEENEESGNKQEKGIEIKTEISKEKAKNKEGCC